MATGIKAFTGGMSTNEIVTTLAAGTGGLAASTMLPGVIIKVSDPASTTQKIGLVLLSAVSAIAAGSVAKQFLGAKEGNAAMAGGLAGTGAIAIYQFGGYSIQGLGGGVRRIAPAAPRPRIGNADVVSSPFARDGETVSIIQP